MEYVHSQYEGQKLTLTEKSSQTIFSRDRRRADRREESTLVTRKVYRYERTDEKPRDITMECIQYDLTTTGGR